MWMTFERWFELVWVSCVMEFGWKLFLSELSGLLFSVRAWEQHCPGDFPPPTGGGLQQRPKFIADNTEHIIPVHCQWQGRAVSLGMDPAGKWSCFPGSHIFHRHFQRPYQKGQWINSLSELDSFFVPGKSPVDEVKAKGCPGRSWHLAACSVLAL